MRRFLLPAACLVVAGCYTPDRADRDEVVLKPPASWVAKAAPEGDVQGDWWLRFRSPELNAVIEQTLANNPDLRQAEARLFQAASLARIAGADLYPTLDANFNPTRQRLNFIGIFPGAVQSRTFNNFGVNLSTAWELDIWGRIRAGRKAAVADLESSVEDLRALRQSLAAQSAKAWLAVAEAREQLDLARRTVTSFRSTEVQVRDRFERGVRSPLDVRLARVNLAAGEANEQLWSQRLAAAVRQLETLQGYYPAGRSKTEVKMPQAPGPVPTGLPAELLKRRPDLLALEHRLVAAGFRVDQAQAALYPRISLTSTGGTASDELSDLGNSSFFAWSVAGNLVQHKWIWTLEKIKPK